MKIRLGFVAMSLNLVDASPSKTITYTMLQKMPNDHARLYKLKKLTQENLDNTLRILTYAQSNGIFLYRFTSKLVPLATHSNVINWDYVEQFKDKFLSIGNFIKKHNMAVSAHPDHYTILNSPREEVIRSSFADLEYHHRILEAMELNEDAKLVIHVGGAYSNKNKAIDRFKHNFSLLPSSIRARIILENDDKIYTAQDVLSICQDLSIPMVLDVHHYMCNPGNEKLQDLLFPIFETWRGQNRPPKVHFSSPKSDKQFCHHAPNINPDDFISFIQMVYKFWGKDIDVMLEAKNKDVAVFNLIDNLKHYECVGLIPNKAIIKYKEI